MTIPQIAFPVAQEDIKAHREVLMNLIKGREAEIKIMRTMLDMLEKFCNHKKKSGYVCLDCGWDTSPDY